MNQQGVENNQWKWNHVKEACLDLKTWFWFVLMFAISYVFSQSLGYDYCPAHKPDFQAVVSRPLAP